MNYRKIEKLRERKNLTQEQAAQLAGMKSRQHWNNIEKGRQVNINIDLLERIAKALDSEPAELLH